MSAQTDRTDALMALLIPEVRKLAENAPAFGELVLRANIHDYDVGRISLGIETSRRIGSRSNRGGSR
jgi:hypothetical protein